MTNKGNDKIARRVVVVGLVQGVGYRYWAEHEAARRGLDGWVRNMSDGSVEAVFSGPEADVREMIEACHKGPPAANVMTLHEDEATHPADPGFGVLPTG